MVKIKNIIMILVLIISGVVIAFNYDKILEAIPKKEAKREIIINPSNEYTTDYSFSYVQISKDYQPKSYHDLINIFYNVLNNGWDDFRFYCPEDYTDCLKDVEKLSGDSDLLSVVNNMVHPYNSYDEVKVIYDDTGEINIKIKHLYTEEEIAKIEKEIDKIMKNNTTASMDTETKIKTLHDYIINNTKYDTLKADKKSKYDSERMTGLLFEHYAICSGYSDTMAVILNKLGVKNYRIISANHVWNAVYLNSEWLHLDLTWDDPITTSGNDILTDTYFLIDTETLFENPEAIKEHTYDKNIYKEFK